ncbi:MULTISPECIES: type VI secretion system baseplate subunit TssE [unclassified Duganella]|uniref:type VI secretion system baseplate subunit TssE n=1 Tax=unclassified Duganella TaxID=2636909 RepID=UPI0006FB0923|nr:MULTISPECIES: type VI secretion system baseplate subunit TssE [unclassified Duganella]KQV61431.1 type VI secretion protein, lysozyme-like protein [Duganella sp. Root336D2]KRB92476.1 type VI secretion protein, lysozyme-like protein [Duganella sp. Root198D2]
MKLMPANSVSPLFDRLAGISDAAGDGRLLDADGLQQSVLTDLSRLFNSRNGLTIEQFLGDQASSLHYGLPDTLRLSPQSAADLAQWERVVARAVALYEPRLSQVVVKVERDPGKPVAARIRIGGAVTLGLQQRQVHFDCLLDGRAASLEPAA